MQLGPFRNEYDFARHIVFEHQIADLEQSSIIKQAYAFLLLQARNEASVRDLELVVTYQFVDHVGTYVVRTRHRDAESNEVSKAAFVLLVNGSMIAATTIK